MRNKKLYAAVLVGTMAVGMMGSTVMADPTGQTNFNYISGTITPPDPVNPDDSETDPNNWAITYDRNITLGDDNVGTLASEVQTKGAKIGFEVKQKVAGADGQYDVKEENIGTNGLSVKTTADASWSGGTLITMAGGSGVTMQLANSTNLTADVLAPDEEIVNLTAGRTSDNGFAAITGDSKAVDGVTYSKTITWTVSKK